MSSRVWSHQQTVQLYEILDNFLRNRRVSMTLVVDHVHAQFQCTNEGEPEGFTKKQIYNKIYNFARGVGTGGPYLIQNWHENSAKLRDVIEGTTKSKDKRKIALRPKQPTRKNRTKTEGHPGEDGVDSEQEHSSGSTNRTSVHDQRQSDSPLSSTVSINSHEFAECLVHHRKDQGPPTRPVNLQHGEWMILEDIRRLARGPAYELPPAENSVRETLRSSMHRIKKSTPCFMVGANKYPVLSLGSLLATQQKLFQVLNPTAAAGEDVETGLNTLITGPGVSVEVFFGAVAAAAMYHWVLNSFDQRLKDVSSATWGQSTVLEIFETRKYRNVRSLARIRLLTKSPDGVVLAENLKYSDMREYIDRVVVPDLPGYASVMRRQLYDAFASLTVSSMGPGHLEGADFQSRKRSMGLWEKDVEVAFLEVLRLRASMAKSSLTYTFRFPIVGDEYKADWMETVYGGHQVTEPQRLVYLCLRPAVFSHQRYADEVVVSPALVMLEGQVPDLGMI